MKVIGNFAEHAPKQRPFGGILPLQGSFLSISWLVLAAIFSFVGFFALPELVLRVLLVVWLLFCQFWLFPKLFRDGFREFRQVWRPFRALLKSVRLWTVQRQLKWTVLEISRLATLLVSIFEQIWEVCTVGTRTSLLDRLFSKRTLWPQLRESLYRWHAYKLIGQTIFQTDSVASKTRIFVPLTRVQPSRTVQVRFFYPSWTIFARSGRLYACQRYKDSRNWGHWVRLENSLSNKLVRVPTVQTFWKTIPFSPSEDHLSDHPRDLCPAGTRTSHPISQKIPR